MKVCRRITFNAAHRLFNPAWSDEQNLAVFGKCSNPNFHGHNYVLETWIDGEVDEMTGYVIDLRLLKNILEEEISDRFDHRNLNLDCSEFENKRPSAENIAIVCHELIAKRLDSKYKVTVRLWETQNNSVEYSGN
ncbi:MAG: 6-carboxytetrahydropterin synthase [Bacteroidota bacterium]